MGKPRAGGKGGVLVDTAEAPWYELEPAFAAAAPVTLGNGSALRALGEAALATEVAAWEAHRASGETGDDRYMAQVLKSGTLADKVAALTLMLQESPVHRLGALDQLLATAKAGRHTSKMAIESLKEFFCGAGGLPDGRRLAGLEAREPSARGRRLVLYAFEDALRARYAAFVGVVAGYLKHQAKDLRRFACETAAALLAAKPEKEAEILALLVNKLGDPEPSVAARSATLLGELLSAHRAMTPVVAKEAMAFCVRNPAVGPRRASVAFLSQLFLSPALKAVASDLVAFYAALFRAAVAEGALHSKLLAALLAGVNRAFPYADRGAFASEVDALFGVSHAGTFPTRVSALHLLERLAGKDQRPRFLRAVYDLLDAPEARAAGKPTLLFNLLFKACDGDDDIGRSAALLKRAAQLGAHGSPPVAAAAVYLAARVGSSRPALAAALLAGGDPEGEGEWRDMRKRDPAGPVHLWEAALLRRHYHPSVRAFADQLCANPSRPLAYKGDPLEDLGLAKFLDRFAYRNPRPAKSRPHAKTAREADAEPAATSTRPEDAFLRRYFSEAAAKKARAATRRAADDDADDDVVDDAGDADADVADDLVDDSDLEDFGAVESGDDDDDDDDDLGGASDGSSSDGEAFGLPMYDSDGSGGDEEAAKPKKKARASAFADADAYFAGRPGERDVLDADVDDSGDDDEEEDPDDDDEGDSDDGEEGDSDDDDDDAAFGDGSDDSDSDASPAPPPPTPGGKKRRRRA